MFLDDCCAPFHQSTIIVSSVLVNFTSIGPTVCRDILLISSALYPEDNFMEAAHAWVFVVNSGGVRGGIFVSTNVSLMMFPSDTLKASHAFTKTEFM